MTTMGKILSISVSLHKGEKKRNISKAVLKRQHGVVGDAHAGSARQVSLLPFESFEKVRGKLDTVAPGDFAENITTVGLDFTHARVGARLQVGGEAQLEITRIGQECHDGCYIKDVLGDCIMPREGIFATVIESGDIAPGDRIGWLES